MTQLQKKHYEAICRAAGELNLAHDLTMILVPTENKHKYVIRGLAREIDIFHVDDIASVIVKYHLGCVRAWYDGTTVHCFPSFITAANLGINMDIRWTSNRKDVRDIVLKYFQRGFGTIINTRDRLDLIAYVNASAQWCHLNPPVHARRHWQINQYWAKPLFHDNFAAMFNPSRSRYGIHKYLNTVPHVVNIPPPDIHPRYRRWGAKKQTAADFKTSQGVVVLPTACSSIARCL